MPLFKNQLTAAREKRVEVDLQAEDTVGVESFGENVDGDIDVDAIFDQFSEDRDRLNAMLEEVAVESLEAAKDEEEEEEAVNQVEDTVVQEEPSIEQEETPVQEAPAEVVAEEAEPEKNEDLPEDAVPADDVVEDEVEEEDETMVAEMELMESLESDVMMIEQDSRELTMISDSIVAIESFGINPSAIAILQTTGLLSGTVLDAVGVESLGYAGPKDDQTMIALEALEAKAEEKKASWGAKILSMAKNIGSKTLAVVEPIWEKIASATKDIAGYAWDKTKAGAAVVKAHPYKTVLGVIAAIAAVAGIMVFTGAGLPAIAGKPAAAIIKFSEAIATKVNSIKWPFGDIAATVSEQTGKLSLSINSNMAAAKATVLGKMGWTKTVVNGVNSQLGRAWAGVKTGVEAVGNGLVKVNKTIASMANIPADMIKDKVVGATGKPILGFGAWVATTYYISSKLWSLFFGVVATGLRVIYSTLKAIANAVKGTEAAA